MASSKRFKQRLARGPSTSASLATERATPASGSTSNTVNDRGLRYLELGKDILMTTQRQHVFDTIPGPGKVRRREYQGVRSDEGSVSLTEYIRREVATVDWVNEHDFSPDGARPGSRGACDGTRLAPRAKRYRRYQGRTVSLWNQIPWDGGGFFQNPNQTNGLRQSSPVLHSRCSLGSSAGTRPLRALSSLDEEVLIAECRPGISVDHDKHTEFEITVDVIRHWLVRRFEFDKPHHAVSPRDGLCVTHGKWWPFQRITAPATLSRERTRTSGMEGRKHRLSRLSHGFFHFSDRGSAETVRTFRRRVAAEVLTRAQCSTGVALIALIFADVGQSRP